MPRNVKRWRIFSCWFSSPHCCTTEEGFVPGALLRPTKPRQKQLNLGKSWMHPRSLVGRWWLGDEHHLRKSPSTQNPLTAGSKLITTPCIYIYIYMYSHVYVYEMVCNSMYACMYAYVHTTAGYKDLAHKIGPDPRRLVSEWIGQKRSTPLLFTTKMEIQTQK